MLSARLIQPLYRQCTKKRLGTINKEKTREIECFASIEILVRQYCIVLYCIVLYCIVLYCIVLYCTVLYCIVLYCIVLYCIVLYCIVLYCIVLYCIVLYCIVLYCIVLYCIVLYCIVLYCIVLYCIVLYCIVGKRISDHYPVCGSDTGIYTTVTPCSKEFLNQVLHKACQCQFHATPHSKQALLST